MAFLTDESGSFAFVKLIKDLIGGVNESDTVGTLTLTVPSNLTWLSIGAFPVTTRNGKATLRSGLVMMSNIGDEAKTISANTVFGTYAQNVFTASTAWACVLFKNNGTAYENTVKAGSAKSLAFTANQEFPANSTLYLFIEEN